MIGQAQRGNTESFNKSIDDFNAAKNSYNTNVQKLEDLKREIAHE
jgi:hypothetical protein